MKRLQEKWCASMMDAHMASTISVRYTYPAVCSAAVASVMVRLCSVKSLVIARQALMRAWISARSWMTCARTWAVEARCPGGYREAVLQRRIVEGGEQHPALVSLAQIAEALDDHEQDVAARPACLTQLSQKHSPSSTCASGDGATWPNSWW